jgi:hypothetical protein
MLPQWQLSRICRKGVRSFVDLYVTTDLRTMTELWMGYTNTARAKNEDRLVLTGNRQVRASFQAWLDSSRFAKMEKCIA